MKKHNSFNRIRSALFILGLSTNLTAKANQEQQQSQHSTSLPSLQGDSMSTSHTKVEYITTGQGEVLKKGDKITVHYTGWLDHQGKRGAKFDSSKDRGTPFSFLLGKNHVIRGWDEGLLGVPVGSVVTLHIPSDMAYGAGGAGSTIPPHSNLIFEVEVLKAE